MSGLLLVLLIPLATSVPTSYNRFSSSSHSYSYGSSLPRYVSKPLTRTVPIPSRPTLSLSRSSQAGSGDIVQQTRTQAESLKKDLRSMARNPRAAEILNKVFADRNNVCFNNMDDAIEAIESSTTLFENAGREIKQLIENVKVFDKITDTSAAVKETAKIIRVLDVLIPKITPVTSTCKASSDEVFGSLRSLGVLVTELSSTDDIFFSIQKRQSLKNSANIVTRVTNFLTKLTKSFSKFNLICSSDKSYNMEVITGMVDMMADLADLYRAVGGESSAQEIRIQGDFTKKLVANIQKLGHLDMITLDCKAPQSSQLVANALEELAGLIEEVGMENLCNQLDLDCSFALPATRSLASKQTPTVLLPGSGDIIEQTRTQAESLKTDLQSMSRNPRATKVLSKVFAKNNNVCINNMEDAIEAIESSTQIFENAGTEIKQLVEVVKVFEKKTDTSTAVRETANIIRLLDDLIPKLRPTNPSSCQQGADEFESLRGLAALVDELSSKEDLYYSIQKRQSLKSSAKIVSKATNFLAKIKQSFSKFDKFCTRDKSYNIEVIATMGDMMTDLAGLYRALGGVAAAEEITKQGDFIKKIKSNIQKLGDLELVTLDCNSRDSSQLVAKALDDLAGLIDEVGMENLCKQLDLDCEF